MKLYDLLYPFVTTIGNTFRQVVVSDVILVMKLKIWRLLVHAYVAPRNLGRKILTDVVERKRNTPFTTIPICGIRKGYSMDDVSKLSNVHKLLSGTPNGRNLH